MWVAITRMIMEEVIELGFLDPNKVENGFEFYIIHSRVKIGFAALLIIIRQQNAFGDENMKGEIFLINSAVHKLPHIIIYKNNSVSQGSVTNQA